MTDKDKSLIQQAEHTASEFMGELIEQAESDEARDILHSIDKRHYYREKFRSDNY